MLKHLFLIQTHHQPELLARLIDRLSSPNHYFLVHVDKKTDIRPFIRCIHNANCHIMKHERLNVRWGGWSQWQCTLLLLRKGLASDMNFDYYHLLSGADYPLCDNLTFDRWFDEHEGESFMHYDTDEEVAMWRDAKYRYRLTWHFTDFNEWLQRLFAKLHVSSLLNRYVPRPDVPNLIGGWSWWSWHASVARWVLRYCDEHVKQISRFKFSRCSDELIFHTILYPYIGDLNINAHNSLRYIDWHPRREYDKLPLLLDIRDVDVLKSSPELLCRKVLLPESEKLLDWIDRNIICRNDE